MTFEQTRQFTIGVVIVNYRTPALVEACVASLAPMLKETNAGVVIVDNASGDGSFERLSRYGEDMAESDRILVLASPRNGGFSAGNNLGAKAISSQFALFLNSDASVKHGALKALLIAAARNPKAGLFTPQIVSSTGAPVVSRFRNHTILSEFVDGAQTGPITKLFRNAEVPIFPQDLVSVPDWVSFAAVMVRREAMDCAGPMDERFFLYYEDCDYCRRLVRCGYRIASAPDAVFMHDAGGSTKLRERSGAGARLPAYYYASRSRYFRKYYGAPGPALANLAWYAGRGIAKIRGIFGRPAPKVCQARARDIWTGWRGDDGAAVSDQASGSNS